MHNLQRPLSEIQELTAFLDFCRSVGDEVYDPTEPDQCAIAQFGKPGLTVEEIDDLADGLWGAIAHQGVRYGQGVYTFSALADRIQSLIPDVRVVS